MEIIKNSHGEPIKVLGYDVSYSQPEVLGSGSIYSRMAWAGTETEALALLADGRNELTRTVKQADGRLVYHWYDVEIGAWRDSQNCIV